MKTLKFLLAFAVSSFSTLSMPAAGAKPLVESTGRLQFSCTSSLARSSARYSATVTFTEPSAVIQLEREISIHMNLTRRRSLVIEIYAGGVKKSSFAMKGAESMIGIATSEVDMSCFRQIVQ